MEEEKKYLYNHEIELYQIEFRERLAFVKGRLSNQPIIVEKT